MMTFFSTFIVTRLQQGMLNPQHRYLLIDTSAVKSAAISLPILTSLPSIDILRGRAVEWKDTASPVLIQLPVQLETFFQSQQWVAFFEKWRWANAFIYVESSYPFKKFSQALAKRTDVQLGDEQAMLLRYFDTRIFASLLDVLAPDQQASFLEIADAWHYPNRDGILVTLTNIENNTSLHHHDAFRSPLKLTIQQEFKMLETSETDTMVNLLLTHQETPLSSMNPFQQHNTIDSLLNVARTNAILKFNEQAMFCILGLALGKNFYRVEPWVSGLEQIKNKTLNLNQLLSTLEMTT